MCIRRPLVHICVDYLCSGGKDAADASLSLGKGVRFQCKSVLPYNSEMFRPVAMKPSVHMENKLWNFFPVWWRKAKCENLCVEQGSTRTRSNEQHFSLQVAQFRQIPRCMNCNVHGNILEILEDIYHSWDNWCTFLREIEKIPKFTFHDVHRWLRCKQPEYFGIMREH
ncbi:hypothetical protein Y032_0142g2295 [Ancylostoma ceylanicum]|uniref:Uncharacterized protein n=1 Tax=Ancylostoma ceylanicum TaxID=53326 RepID=A0A016T397_9BILA|nr:hypothetical protein Y032_0142g2295 [Ancylostoma ceylanicum]